MQKVKLHITAISRIFVHFKTYFYRDAKEIKVNRQVGHMLRTKLSHVNEGGVAAGLGALDSVILVDQERCCNGPCIDCNCCKVKV